MTMKQLSLISSSQLETQATSETVLPAQNGSLGVTMSRGQNLPRLCEKESLRLNSAQLWLIKTGLEWA